MKARLSAEEAGALSKYRFAVEIPSTAEQRTLACLLDGPHLSAFLKELAGQLGAPDIKTAASILMKRLAFLAVIHLYAMTAFGKRLETNPEKIILVEEYNDGLWLPAFHFISQETITCTQGSREEWREESIRQLFAENLFPLMDALAKEAKIPKLILWENVAIYIYWLYEKVLPEIAKEKAPEDFAYLLHTAPGYLFGDYNRNPLTRYHSEPVYLEEVGSFERIRRTCCFSYKVKDGSYCKTCPIVCK